MDRPKNVSIEIDDETWTNLQLLWATRPDRHANADTDWQRLVKACLSSFVRLARLNDGLLGD